MKRLWIPLILLGGGLLALAQHENGAAGQRIRPIAPAAPFATEDTSAPEAKADTNNGDEAAKKAILANVKNYMEAFNKQDVKGIVALFTEDCEVTEDDGTVVHGLKELEKELKEDFADEPTARISVEVDSLRFISPDVAIEQGKTTYYPDGKTLTAETEYHVTHVKKGDRWLMSQARSFNRTVLSPYDRLRDLEWLVGSWVDEGAESLIESTYRWDENKTFLLHDFTIRVKGKNVLKGTQRIGWDPLSRQIKSWVFDSGGGYAESVWTLVDDTWVIKLKGVRSDGKVVTATNRLTKLSKDRMRFESVDHFVGEDRYPDINTLVVRSPPPAKR